MAVELRERESVRRGRENGNGRRVATVEAIVSDLGQVVLPFDVERAWTALLPHCMAPAGAVRECLPRLGPGIHAEPRVRGSIFAINRDIRFSNDKSPYKPYLDLWFWQGDGPSRERPGRGAAGVVRNSRLLLLEPGSDLRA